MPNVRFEFEHGCPNPAESFSAKLYQGGRKVVLTFKGKTVTINHDNGESPIELIGPSVDGRILWCSLRDGRLKLFETATGSLVTLMADGSVKDKPDYRPEFYA